ncbi:MAG: hypothetical protein AB8G77_28105 [Rhodothermales bacterium]
MNQYRINLLNFLFLAVFVLFAASCDSEEPDTNDAGEEELITRVTITLTPDNGGADVIVEANDADGDGANFQIGSLTLTPNTSYSGSIAVFDDINNENINAEIAEEADEHQFFYTPMGDIVDRVVVTITDQDENGLPVGLDFTLEVTAGTDVSGELQVVLSHYDVTRKNGVAMSSESDIDLTFPVTVTEL